MSTTLRYTNTSFEEIRRKFNSTHKAMDECIKEIGKIVDTLNSNNSMLAQSGFNEQYKKKYSLLLADVSKRLKWYEQGLKLAEQYHVDAETNSKGFYNRISDD